MRKKIIAVSAGLITLIALSIAMLSAAAGSGHDELMVEVSITNLTRGQILSPVFVARHDRNAPRLYALGQPASDALAAMAEDADAAGLLEQFVHDSVSEALVAKLIDGPIPPGQTVTFSFDVKDGKQLLSLASMLVSTNDAFIGANALDLSKSHTVYLNAYDSGSEANSEDCQYIPGPPCGNHVADEAPAEGFVHVHAGIHGGADLDPAEHDWRNPVARLVIKTWMLSR